MQASSSCESGQAVSPGLLERLTVVASDAGQLIALNLYRLESTGAFTDEELGVVDAV